MQSGQSDSSIKRLSLKLLIRVIKSLKKWFGKFWKLSCLIEEWEVVKRKELLDWKGEGYECD